MKKKYSLLLIIYFIAIIVMTIIPHLSFNPKIGFGILRFRLDYWLHFFTYFGTAAIFVIWKFKSLIESPIRAVLVTMIFWFLFAFSTEIIQLFVPSRSFSFKDFIANSMGITFAYALFFLFKLLFKKHKISMINILVINK